MEGFASSGRQQRADAILREAISSCESWSVSSLAKQHPELSDELSSAERRWNLVQRAKQLRVSETQSGSSFNSHAAHGSPSTPHVRASPPSGLGPFRLMEKVGTGSFGTVWRSVDSRFDQEVALKIAHAEKPSPRHLKRLRREAEANGQLSHPNIIPVLEVGEDSGRFYIASKFIDGESLAALIERQRPSARRAVEIVSILARALEHAHRLGVVHRDIKPANIIMDRNGDPHLADFGLAKSDHFASQLTRDGDVFGTPTYMSPEQAAGDNDEVTGLSDVYSLGVVLYQCLTAELPFRGHHAMLRYQVLYDLPPSPRTFQPSIPIELETICHKCLEKRPASRYRSAAALGDDLDRFLAKKPIVAKPRGKIAWFKHWMRRHPWYATSLVWLVLLCAVMPFLAMREMNLRRSAQQSHAEALIAMSDTLLAGRGPGQQIRVVDSIELATDLLGKERSVEENRTLRNQLIAALAKPDWDPIAQWELEDRVPSEVAFDWENSRYAHISSEGQIKIRDLESDTVVSELPANLVPMPVRLVFSPCSRYLAIGSSRPLEVWNIEDSTRCWISPYTGPHGWCYLEGKIYTGTNRNILVHDFENDSDETFSIASPSEDKEAISLTAVKRNDDIYVAISAHPAGVDVVKLGDALPHRLRSQHTACSLEFSPNGDFLAAGSRFGGVTLWTNPTMRHPRARQQISLAGHSLRVVDLHFDPGSSFLASNSADGASHVWDFASQTELLRSGQWVAGFDPKSDRVAIYDRRQASISRFVESPIRSVLSAGPINSLAITHDSKNVVFKSKGRLVLWPLGAKQPSDWLPTRGRTKDLYPLREGARQFILSGSRDGIARVEVDLEKRRFVDDGELWLETRNDDLQIDTAQDGSWLCVERRTGKITLHGRPSDNEESNVQSIGKHHRAACVSMSANAEVAATSGPGEIKLWDLKNRSLIRTVEKTFELPYIQISPNGELLAIGDGRTLRLYDVKQGQVVHEQKRPGIGPSIGILAFSPDGKVTAMASSRNEVQLIRTDTLEEIALLRSPNRSMSITELCFSPDGNSLFCCHANGIECWNLSEIDNRLEEHGLAGDVRLSNR